LFIQQSKKSVEANDQNNHSMKSIYCNDSRHIFLNQFHLRMAQKMSLQQVPLIVHIVAMRTTERRSLRISEPADQRAHLGRSENLLSNLLHLIQYGLVVQRVLAGVYSVIWAPMADNFSANI